MPRPLPPGLYERLVSRGLDRELRELDPERFDVHRERPAPSELPRATPDLTEDDHLTAPASLLTA